ncbi:chemotaxis protein CheD [Niveibacterium sp. SC-1]|uniref:chemotaxis protein CheD n=1 Tax=Niveibacterium sp. SC-1 TaxID=3135646 RepID=UPI00311D5470
MSIKHVHAGEIGVGGSEDELRTVLGSCVAITLWHPQRRIGVMSHVQLPMRSPRRRHGRDARYAEDAWLSMLESLHEMRVPISECECKMFGGARVFANAGTEVGAANVGDLRGLLAGSGVRLIREHVEGTGHRVIRFIVSTGDVWVSHRPQPVGAEAATTSGAA